MAWKERSYMDERMLLVSEYLRGEQSMAELCRAAGVSRKTAYKWVTRYRDEGPKGLANSCTPSKAVAITPPVGPVDDWKVCASFP